VSFQVQSGGEGSSLPLSLRHFIAALGFLCVEEWGPGGVEGTDFSDVNICFNEEIQTTVVQKNPNFFYFLLHKC
jgi:hypothetical protein